MHQANKQQTSQMQTSHKVGRMSPNFNGDRDVCTPSQNYDEKTDTETDTDSSIQLN